VVEFYALTNMTSPLKRIEHPHEAKRLIGISDQFLFSCIALAEARDLLTKTGRTKVRINAKGGGRKAEMSAQEGSVFTSIFEAKPILKFWLNDVLN